MWFDVGKRNHQWSSQRLAVLPFPMEWESGLAKQDFWWSVNNPSSLSNYFPFGCRALFLPNKQFLVQFEIILAVRWSHGTTPHQQMFLAWPNRNCICICIITTVHLFPLWRNNFLLNFKVVYWLRETVKHQLTEGRAVIWTKHCLST